MKYYVVVGNSPEDLTNKVNIMLSEGWICDGGLAVSIPAAFSGGASRTLANDTQVNVTGFGNELRFYQAVTFRD